MSSVRATNSYITTSRVTSHAIPAPASVVVGDILVVHCFGRYWTDATSVTLSPPANWTQLYYNQGWGNSSRIISGVWYKEADAADAAASTFTWTASNAISAGATIVSAQGVDTGAPIRGNGRNTQTGVVASMTFPAVAATEASDLVLRLFGNGATNVIEVDPADDGHTQIVDQVDSTANSQLREASWYIIGDATTTTIEVFNDFFNGETITVTLSTATAGPTDFLYPAADNHVGNYKDEGGATTNLFESLDETVAPFDDDYIMSEASPSASPYAAALDPYPTPPAGTVTLHFRLGKLPTGSATQINFSAVELREGYVSEASPGTLIASTSQANVGVFTTYTLILSTVERDSITNWSDLHVRLVASVV